MDCPQCDQKIESEQNFCPNCGFEIGLDSQMEDPQCDQKPQSEPDLWHIETEPCPHCGHQCSTTALNCPACLKQIRAFDKKLLGKISNREKTKAAAGVVGATTVACAALFSPILLLCATGAGINLAGKAVCGLWKGPKLKRNLATFAKEKGAVDCITLPETLLGYSVVWNRLYVTNEHFYHLREGMSLDEVNVVFQIRRDQILDINITERQKLGFMKWQNTAILFKIASQDETVEQWFEYENEPAENHAKVTAALIDYYRV